MIFELDGYIVELDDPAQYPYAPVTKLVQAKEMSASGITHVEDFSVQTDTFKYNFKNASQSDYEKIMEWFVNTVTGMLTPFNLTDDLGATRNVRFTTSTIPFTSNSYNLWDGSFTVEVVQ